MINGIAATFNVQSFSEAAGRLQGVVNLENKTDHSQEFRVERNFCLHLHIEDRNNRELKLSPRLGNINPIADGLNIGPGESISRSFEAKITDFFVIEPGLYKISFIYDVRLYRPRVKDEWPYVDWSNEGFLVRYIGAATK